MIGDGGGVTHCAGSRSPGAALGPAHNGTATAFGRPQVLFAASVSADMSSVTC